LKTTSLLLFVPAVLPVLLLGAALFPLSVVLPLLLPLLLPPVLVLPRALPLPLRTSTVLERLG
jgi:hypothetical protein